MAGTRPWSSSAEGRSWRARLSSSSIAWFTRRLSSATSCALLGGTVLGQRLEPQQDRGERLVHLVVEVAGQAAALLLLGRASRAGPSGGAPAPRARAGAGRTRPGGRSPPPASRRSSSEAGSEGSTCSMRSIRRSSGRKRRWSIHMFTQRVSMIARASTRNCQRSLVHRGGRGRPRGSAARSVRATSTHIGGHDLADERIVAAGHPGSRCRSEVPMGTNGVVTPYRHGGALRRESL